MALLSSARIAIGVFSVPLSSSASVKAATGSSLPGFTSEADRTISLDDHEIEEHLPGWREMIGNVEVVFVKRNLIPSAVGPAHWAFLLEGNTFYCTIEYGTEGIIIKYYKGERGIDQACFGIMGQMSWVYLHDRVTTNMNFAQILEYVDTMKTEWCGKTYNLIHRNCQHFAQELGRIMFDQFDHTDFIHGLIILLLGKDKQDTDSFQPLSRSELCSLIRQ